MVRKRSPLIYTLMGYALLCATIMAIAVALSFGFSLIPLYPISEDQFARWWTWAACTPALFWFVINKRPRASRNGIFWRTLAGLLVAHIVCFAWVFHAVGRWRMAWTPMTVPVEAYLMFVVLDWTRRHLGERHESRHL